MNSTVNKAVVAVLGGLLTLVGEFGVAPEWATEGLISAVGSMVTAFFVWLVPNKEVTE